MPQVANVHIDAALTNISFAYKSNDYVATEVYPVVPVNKQSDYYYKIDTEVSEKRQIDDRRAPGAEAKEADFEVSNDTYFCEDHALQAIVADEERANADPAIQADIDKVQFLTHRILLNKEIALVSALETATATAGTDLVNIGAGSEWDNYTNGDPVSDVKTGIQRFIVNSYGIVPNVFVLPYETFLGVKDHPDIIDRCKGISSPSAPAVATAQTLAQVFGVDRVLIPRSYKNTATHEGTVAVSAVWGENDAFLVYVTPSPGLRTQTAGYTFAWSGAKGGQGQGGMIVETWREESRTGDMVKVNYYYDQKNVDTNCLYRFANTRG
jgi:hypothetical protein